MPSVNPSHLPVDDTSHPNRSPFDQALRTEMGVATA